MNILINTKMMLVLKKYSLQQWNKFFTKKHIVEKIYNNYIFRTIIKRARSYFAYLDAPENAFIWSEQCSAIRIAVH